MLAVDDINQSIAFYGDLLGGEVSYRFPDEGDPVFVTLQIGDSEIGLGLYIEDEAPLHGQQQRPATGHRIELCVYVEDVDHTVERMRTAAVPIHLEPADQPWGERVAYVEDPDGNLVMLTR